MKISILLSLLSLAACGGESQSTPCEPGQRKCDGASSIRDCIGGAWQAPQPCSAECTTKGLTGGGCVPTTTSAECVCDPTCQEGQTQCEGLTLKTCTAAAWQSQSCDTVCQKGGYPKATGCALDAAKGVEACTCEVVAGWAESCAGTTKPCPSAFTCVTYGGKSFCTQGCPKVGAACTGTPAGTYAGCLIKMSDGTYTCAFLCKTKSASYACPPTMTCSTTENPAGSGQHPCLMN